MAVTLTPRFGEPQWSSGADSPGRTVFNEAFLALDQRGAIDPGVQDTTLPATYPVDGRYAHVVTAGGADRRLYRRGGGAFQQVGGNSWGEPTHHRGAAPLTLTSPARQISHADLVNPGAIENWDGSSLRGGRQAIGDTNAATPGALHVGDLVSVVDLAVRGRVYARTTADGHRAVVASAHGAGAGPLYTARDAGGSDPWTVDAQGRMRAQVPAAFGAGVLTAGVPLISAPGAGDSSAADLYAASAKPALRIYRASGDPASISSFGQDQITLGRASWTGGRVDLIAPNVAVAGAFTVSGASALSNTAVIGALGVSGLTTLGAASATSLSTPALSAGAASVSGDATVAGVLTAQGARIASVTAGVGADLRADYAIASTPYRQSLRHSVVTLSSKDDDVTITTGTQNYDIPITVKDDCWIKLTITLWVIRGNLPGGSSARVYMSNAHFTPSLRSGASAIYTGLQYTAGVGDDYNGGFLDHPVTLTEMIPTRLTAGAYTVRIAHIKDTNSTMPMLIVNATVIVDHVILAATTVV